MKLFKSIILTIAATLLIQGCTKEYYGTTMYTRIYSVRPNDWIQNTGDQEPGAYNYWYATFENPDINAAVIERGAVQAFVYAIYNAGTNEGSWNPLPYVYPYEVTTNDGTIVVAENTRFEYEPGSITFVIQDLDGYDPVQITNPMTIKVCVTL